MSGNPAHMRTVGSALAKELSTMVPAANGSSTADGNITQAVVHAAQETAGAFTTLERQLRHTDSFNDVKAVDAGASQGRGVTPVGKAQASWSDGEHVSSIYINTSPGQLTCS